ncbi:hypothetical protein GS966_25720 [Rhodococcus hoagii]|nr:hypothetical protein [Prescottella equi]NKS61653.1 hypothetical protein [Prescottella equi]NKZ93242.1 hypothetical protein [Prescottella equi]NKZ93302.1 hypothetical protein [Prescottella equi]
MNREELGRAIKAACANLDESPVVVLGSQSILGSYDTTELPEVAFYSREVDILPLSGITNPPAVEEKLLMLDARLGENSPFHEHHGFYVEGIHKDVVVLPRHWDSRLVHFTVADGSSELYGRTGLCLDPIDLCVSKCIAGRPKDHEFVAALVQDDIVTVPEILERIDKHGIEWPPTYDSDKDLAVERARSWLTHLGPAPSTAVVGADGAAMDQDRDSSVESTGTAPQGHPWTLRQMLGGMAAKRSEKGTTALPNSGGQSRDRGEDLSL